MELSEEHLSNLGFRPGMRYWVLNKQYYKNSDLIKIQARIAHNNDKWIMMVYGEKEVKGAEILSVEEVAEVFDLFPEFRTTALKVKTYVENHK